VNLEYWISTTFSLLGWLFFHTIYGMLVVAILVYLLVRDLRKTFPRFPAPALVAGLVFLVGVGTLPSIPRYQFHNEMLKMMLPVEDSSHWLASTSRWRSMAEPLTWVNPPIGAVTVISPQTSHLGGDGQWIRLVPSENRFYEWTTRYGEEPAESLVEADCIQSTIRYTRLDESGALRPVTPSPVKMVAREKDWYCEHDWSREREALLRRYRRNAPAHVSVVSLVSQSDGLTYTCAKACQLRVIPYVMGPDPHDGTTPNSRSAADQLFGAKMCTNHGMRPIQVMMTWQSGIQEGYHTRHWAVLCAKAAVRR
jgi:hypothetical protein